jgi:SOS-response transcriptional repressor LexA
MNDTALDIFRFIVSYEEENGYTPVIREIRDGCDISSTSVVAYHLNKLVANGAITKEENRARTIKIHDKSIIDPVT